MSEVPIDTRRAVWTFVSVLMRGLVAALFIYVAITKLADLPAFAKSIRSYQLFPDALSNLAAFAVPGVEIIAALVLFGPWRSAARLLVALMLLVFTAMKISVLARGMTIACGCVSEDSVLAPLFSVGWGIVTNCVVLAIVALDALVGRRQSRPSSVPIGSHETSA